MNYLFTSIRNNFLFSLFFKTTFTEMDLHKPTVQIQREIESIPQDKTQCTKRTMWTSDQKCVDLKHVKSKRRGAAPWFQILTLHTSHEWSLKMPAIITNEEATAKDSATGMKFQFSRCPADSDLKVLKTQKQISDLQKFIFLNKTLLDKAQNHSADGCSTPKGTSHVNTGCALTSTISFSSPVSNIFVRIQTNWESCDA